MQKQSFRWWAHGLGISTHGCWIWQGELNDRGYMIRDGKFVRRAMAFGSLKQGVWNGVRFRRQVNHRCMVKRCVNPLHLAVVSRTGHRKWHERNGWFKAPGLVSAHVFPDRREN